MQRIRCTVIELLAWPMWWWSLLKRKDKMEEPPYTEPEVAFEDMVEEWEPDEPLYTEPEEPFEEG
jgi:hypothetical protein